MKPNAIPSVIDQKNGIPTSVKKHGNATSKLPQSISFREEHIIKPTMIMMGEVAADGTKPTRGEANSATAKHAPVTVEVRPVRPPAAIPEVDST